MKFSINESEFVEYKETLSEKDDGGETICGFANKTGGTLYFGVKNSGVVIGISNVNEKTIRDLTQFYSANLEPKIYFEIVIENEVKPIIKITVKKSSQPAHTFRGRPYIRVGSSTLKMSQDEYQRRLIYYKSPNKDYSSSLIVGSSTNDTSHQALYELRKLLKTSGRYSVNIDKLSDEQLLKDLLLMRDNSLTIAALVLLGTPEALTKFLPYSEIRYGYKLADDETRNQDMEIFTGGYLTYYSKIWGKIDSKNLSISIPLGTRLVERKAFDEETIREAINNAIVHRDYLLQGTTLIFQYPYRIVIRSPGGFPEGVNEENIIDETKPRNKLIADILFKCEMVEQFGNGVNLMYKKQLSLGKLPPNYQQSNDHQVELSLDGKIQDIEFAKYVLRIAEEKDRELTDKELIILNRINGAQKVPSDQITDKLQELGLIERVDYGKYILSKKYYTDINQRWMYTRKKGLSKVHKKEMILEHIKDFDGAHKADLLELFDRSLTEHQLAALLKELKDEDKIYFHGKRRSHTGLWRVKE